ncbi:hypothetical protein PDJ90_25880, partial [Bacillus cereus]|nr:hypothetical protein [Bacillus cereus]
ISTYYDGCTVYTYFHYYCDKYCNYEQITVVTIGVLFNVRKEESLYVLNRREFEVQAKAV